jgi:hypothetical protein
MSLENSGERSYQFPAFWRRRSRLMLSSSCSSAAAPSRYCDGGRNGENASRQGA